MPIIDVLVVGPCQVATEGAAAKRLAEAFGQALGAAEGNVWVRVQVLPAGQYAENGQELQALPVFLEVLHYELPTTEEVLQGQARVLVDAAAAVLERPSSSIHIEFKPPGRGRVAFGGVLAQ